MEEEEKGKQSSFTINSGLSHALHYRVLSNGQRMAASWCFLQKCTINALGRQAGSFNTMQLAKCNRIQATKAVLDRRRDMHCQQSQNK